MGHLCHHLPPAATPQRSLRKAGDAAALPASPLLLLFVLLASSMSACKGAPMPSQALESDEDLQLLKEIDDACSAYLSTDSQPRVSQTEVSSTLEELCFLVMGFLQKPQFLFHYSKTHDSGNSDIMEELEGPRVIQSRGYFFYRPRNGKRSVDFR
ncbi:neuromedin-U isoform X7 [Corvus kubaryi]|uniref:neuromedin-U isoform X7 n=1 Tax=Corvus kubaryi TaxID=68294 RepID=UPI001C054F45|nr:neuromedin-U isoform X7 [Corvus kubaryi]